MQQPRCLFILALMLVCVSSMVRAQTKVLIDDFEKPDDLQWHGGTKLPGDEKSLAIVKDAERGSNVLRAKLIYSGDPIFVTKTLKGPIPFYKAKSISFWYRITTKDLSADRALVCRLRTGPTSFTDYVAATSSSIEPGKWTRAVIDIQHPKKVVNVYTSYFSQVNWITFRLDGEPGKRVEFEFLADDVEIEMKEALALDYTPQIMDKKQAPEKRDVLIIRHSAASYYNIDQIVTSLPIPTSQRTLRFRGLHFPIFDFPKSRDELLGYSLIVLVDVDPYVMPMEHVQWLSDFVASGGGLLVCGGPNTFGHAKDFKKPLADILPVEVIKENDLADVSREPKFAEQHVITAGIPPQLGKVSRAHLLRPRKDATVLLEIASAAPADWGMYAGGGRNDAEVHTTFDAHSGKCAVELVTRDFYKDPKTGKPAWIGVALIQGNSNGYSGQGAYPALGNTKYDFSFWLKGDVPSVEVQCIGWKTLEAESAERQYIKTTVGTVKPDADWKQYKGSFATEKDTRRFVLAFRVSGNPATLTLGQKIIVDDVVVRESGSDKSVISNGGCEEGASIPILAVGAFHKGRVAVLNTYPQVSDRLQGEFFVSDFYDDLMRQTIRWLLRAEPEIQIVQFVPPPHDVMVGDPAKVEVTCDVNETRNAYVTCFAKDRDTDQKAMVLGPGGRRNARYDLVTSEPGVRHIVLEVRDKDGKLIATRTCDLSVHSPIEAEVRFRFGKLVTAPENEFRVRVIGKTWTKEGFVAPQKSLAAKAKLIDFAGEVVGEFPAKPMVSEEGSLPFAEFSFRAPDLSKGAYQLLAEVLDGNNVAATADRELFVVDRLDAASFYPTMSIVGGGEGHVEDEEAIRERVDDLVAHHFNVGAVGGARAFKEWDEMPHHAVLRNYTEAYAQMKDMALIYEYQNYTNIRGDRPVAPCVHSTEYRQALEKHVEPYLEVGATVPRLISIKVIDEPHAGPQMMDYCDDCKRAWRERFGAEMPAKDQPIAKDDLISRRNWTDFVRDYVAKGYSIGHDIKTKSGAEWDLLLTFCSPAYGYARDLAKSQEDLLWWGATADRNDFDVYPYFYPVSNKIVFVQAHFCMALMRNVSQHIGKPWGFYVELDDRNYPMQINPVEASSECAMTAVAQGADYLNSFINVSFGTGKQARPERWEHLGKTQEQIAAAGPLLNVAKTPRARLALFFPYTHWQLSANSWAPHYAHQLLLRAFGEADILHEEVARREKGFACKALALLQTDYLPDDIAKMMVGFVQDGGLLLCDRIPKFNENGGPCKLPAELFAGPADGKGKAVLFDVELDAQFKDAVENDHADRQKELLAKIRNLLFERGLRPHVLADDPDYEIGCREAKDTIVLTAVNHGATEAETNVTLFGPAFEIGYLCDANGAEHSTEKVDNGRQFKLKLKPRCGLILFAYPAQPAEARLDVLTPTVERGATLRYRVTVADARGAACKGRFVIPAKVTDPKGIVRRRYAKAICTTDGLHEAAVPVAVNAPRGEWRIELRDPFSNQPRSAVFQVK